MFVEQLSKDDMTRMLQEISRSGFFAWDEQYDAEPIVDASSLCLVVNLTDQSKTVCTSYGGASDAFNALYTWLAKGAGTTGKVFWPERAYLTGFQLIETGIPLPVPDMAWPETLANISIDSANMGIWLENEDALRSLWDAANQNHYRMPFVESEDGRYRLILQVPGVSLIEP